MRLIRASLGFVMMFGGLVAAVNASYLFILPMDGWDVLTTLVLLTVSWGVQLVGIALIASAGG